MTSNKLSEEMLKQVQDSISAENAATATFANVCFAKVNIEAEHTKAYEAMAAAKKQSAEIRSQLEQEYGQVNINIETGEISPISEETEG